MQDTLFNFHVTTESVYLMPTDVIKNLLLIWIKPISALNSFQT